MKSSNLKSERKRNEKRKNRIDLQVLLGVNVMKIPAVKGTRDFYPPQMAIRNFIVDGWKAISVRNGFEEYDGPVFEYLKMYQVKSGEEIASQLFSFTDRGDRQLAIRPEITPTLARMVNQQINSLPRPVKWFSVPRLCRAERPQKGRLREFFQWNVDIIGVEDCRADAEVIFCAVDFLRQVGLTPDDVVVRISSRKMLAELLQNIGIAQKDLDGLYAVLDKQSRLPEDAFEKMLAEEVADKNKREKVLSLMNVGGIDEIASVTDLNKKAKQAVDEVRRLFEILDFMEVGEYCTFDVGVVRGLAYYTGIVFEIYAKVGELRAICGGGRYDNLLSDLGGPAVTATGFGMGDCVLEILLKEKGLLEKVVGRRQVDIFVACADDSFCDDALGIVARLRQVGKCADFSYKAGGLGKQLKQASALGASICVIVGTEFSERQMLLVKDMQSGQQREVKAESLLAELP